MINVDVNLSLFDKIRGLSCVENYLLYILALRNYDYKHLYSMSFVSFHDAAQFFLNEKKQYAYFSCIPRIQDTAKENGLISLERLDCNNLNIICGLNSYFLFGVKPKYISEQYGISMWRDDHYMLLTDFDKSECTYTYINDNPRDSRTLSSKKMSEAFNGSIMQLQLQNNLTDELKRSFFLNFCQSIIKLNETYQLDDCYDILSVRDMIGALRVLRYRVFEYCSLYIDCSFMLDYLKELDSQYSLIEYKRRRNRVDYNEITQILSKLNDMDNNTIEAIKKKTEYVK